MREYCYKTIFSAAGYSRNFLDRCCAGTHNFSHPARANVFVGRVKTRVAVVHGGNCGKCR
jgi:hypothetical protein